MFSRAPNQAFSNDEHAPNSLIDPTVLALPGALPTLNRAAVEMSIMVGLALGCSIAPRTKWDRKNYFYPDMPKAYQISQYDLPLCLDGFLDVPATDNRGIADLDAPSTRIRITRAHLEEDAGKLLHDAPGGHPIDFSIVDLNRAGTPLLEIVTAPDFRSWEQCVSFAKCLRQLCRFLGVTRGILQRGHMRFEPNINTHLTLADASHVKTPIVEVKNLNSFKSLRGAIEFEARDQPTRWLADRREQGDGTKVTRGWDDTTQTTFVQREKEDAHDYRYFPDPDLPALLISDAQREQIRARIPELPLARFARFVREFHLDPMEADTLTEDPGLCAFYESCVHASHGAGLDRARAGRLAATMLLQSGAKRANERQTQIEYLGITPHTVGILVGLRERGRVSAASADELFGLLCEPEHRAIDPETLAASRGLLIVRDDAALESWCDEVIAANPRPALDVRSGKLQAVGKLVGEVMKKAGPSADARMARELLLRKLAP
jgi:aspartyl-tRNA(Asn)/glutamyl-tRNA(Gln) amidotransferase subunit B